MNPSFFILHSSFYKALIAPPAAPVIINSMMRTMYSSTLFQLFFIRLFFNKMIINNSIIRSLEKEQRENSLRLFSGLAYALLTGFFRRFGIARNLSRRKSLFAFGSRQIHGVLARLFGLQCSGLRNAARYRIEGGTPYEVLEVGTRCKEDIDSGNVVGSELAEGVRSFARKRNSEVAQFVELHFFPFEQHFHQAFAHVGQYPLHLASGMSAVVGYVFHEASKRHDFAGLRLGIRFGRRIGILRIGKIVNRIINHISRPLPVGDLVFTRVPPCPA